MTELERLSAEYVALEATLDPDRKLYAPEELRIIEAMNRAMHDEIELLLRDREPRFPEIRKRVMRLRGELQDDPDTYCSVCCRTLVEGETDRLCRRHPGAG